MHRPCGRTVTAVDMKTVILRVTACGNGLRPGRSHLPTAAVHAAAGPAGRDGNDRTVHLFQRVQLVLVGVDSECQIKASAGALRRSCPCSGIILRFRNTRHIRDLSAARNFFTDQRHNLPRIPCGRIIDVGVVAVFPGLRICTVYQFFCSNNIGLRRVAVGIVFHDPLLGFIVKTAKDVRLFFTAFRIIFKACHNRTVIQHIQTQLAKTAPDVDLVCIVVAGGILAGFKAGHMREAVGGTALGLAVQAVAAAVGFLTVEPNEPCAALLGNTGDFAGGIRRSRPCRKCSNAVVCIKLRRGGFIRQLHMEGFLQLFAIRGGVDKLCGEVGRCFHIQPCGRRRLLGVGLVQDFCLLDLIGGDEVIVGGRIAEKFHTVRQDNFGCCTICWIFRLHQQRNHRIVEIRTFTDNDGCFILAQCIRIHVGIHTIVQVGHPRRNADFGFAGCHRQTHAADVTAGRCIR